MVVYDPLNPFDPLNWDVVTAFSIGSSNEITDHPVEATTKEKRIGVVNDHKIVKPVMITLAGFVSNTPIDDRGVLVRDPTVSTGISGVEGPGRPGTVTNIAIPAFRIPEPAIATRTLDGVEVISLRPRQEKKTIAFSSLAFPERTDFVKLTWEKLRKWQVDGTMLICITDFDLPADSLQVESFDVAPIGSSGNPSDAPTLAGGADVTLTLKRVRFVNSVTTDAPQPKEPRGQSVKSKGNKIGQSGSAGSTTTDVGGVVKKSGFGNISIPFTDWQIIP